MSVEDLTENILPEREFQKLPTKQMNVGSTRDRLAKLDSTINCTHACSLDVQGFGTSISYLFMNLCRQQCGQCFILAVGGGGGGGGEVELPLQTNSQAV